MGVRFYKDAAPTALGIEELFFEAPAGGVVERPGLKALASCRGFFFPVSFQCITSH